MPSGGSRVHRCGCRAPQTRCFALGVLILTIGLAAISARASEIRNIVPNPAFQGTGGSLQGGASGQVPDQWRAFATGGGAAEVSIIPLAANAVYSGSPATNAVKLKVTTFGSDEGVDHNGARFLVFSTYSYHVEFWIKTGNADNSQQSFTWSFPIFDANGTYLGRAPGSGNGKAKSTWTKFTGNPFSDPAAVTAHIAFRASNDGGAENAIIIALPDVEGPPDRFVPPTPAELAEKQTWTAADKLIGTSYFYWYRWPDRHFFDDPAHTDDALTDHFVSPQTVSMDSKDWHKQELLNVMAAGIDMVWPVYWGAPGNFEGTSYTFFWTALAPLQQAIEELQAAGQHPPKVGMFYDTSSLKNSVRLASPPDGAADLTTDAGKDIFYRTIRSFFCTVKPRHWACIDGRPIVLLYASGFAANYSQSSFEYVNTHFAADFGGLTPYIIRDQSWKVQTDSSYRWGAALHGPYIDGIAAVGAGYNDTAVPGRYTPIRMRENGNYYRWSWLQVLRSPAKVVHLETWNEMHEGTDICESTEYSRQYIDLTAFYAGHFKAGTVPDETVTLQYPDPVPRPPNMQDGAEYAGARFVEIYTSGGQKVNAGIDERDAGDGNITAVSHAGDTYLSTDPGYALRYGYFAMKDPFYYDQRRRAQVTIQYLDEGTATVQLQYDSYNASAPVEGAYADGPSLALTNTAGVLSWTAVLEDARFMNRENSGADFRLAVHNGPLYIKRIRVDVLDLPAPVLCVASITPAPDARVAPPASVTVSFTTGVLPSSVSAATVRLVRGGGDGLLGSGDDVPITPVAITASGSQAIVDLTGLDLPYDAYRITLVGRGAAPILDSGGKVLDGRFSGVLPSGDGTGGEDFVSRFHVWVPGDFDNDRHVDQKDFGHLQSCLTGSTVGPPQTGCEDADLNGDSHVDEGDFEIFVRCMSGPDAPIPPGCT